MPKYWRCSRCNKLIFSPPEGATPADPCEDCMKKLEAETETENGGVATEEDSDDLKPWQSDPDAWKK